MTTATPESWAERRWRQYTWGGLYLDELVSYETDGDADGELGETADRTLYVHQDANYNAVAVVLDKDQDAEDGVVQERYEVDAYGRTRFFDKNEQSLPRSGVGLEFLYTGQRLDPETGLYYFKNRYYSADLGRFITHDPAGYQDGWNLYGAYFAPQGTDPEGRVASSEPVGWVPRTHAEPASSRPMRGAAWVTIVEAWAVVNILSCRIPSGPRGNVRRGGGQDGHGRANAGVRPYHNARRGGSTGSAESSPPWHKRRTATTG